MTIRNASRLGANATFNWEQVFYNVLIDIEQGYRFMNNEILTIFVIVVVFRVSTASDELFEMDGVLLCIRRRRSRHSAVGGSASSFPAMYTVYCGEGGR